MANDTAPPTFPDDAILTAEEAAAYLRISASTVYKLCALVEGDPERLPSVYIGRQRRVPYWALKAYIAHRAGVVLPATSGVSSAGHH